MDYLYQKIAYLEGLAEGMEIAAESKEGRLIVELLDATRSIVDELSELHDAQEELEYYTDILDEDLAEIEAELFDDYEDDDDDYFDDFEDEYGFDDFDEDDDEDDLVLPDEEPDKE